ncbi:MAG: butyrate kinase [Oscillospiraceae bacterium]|nr:butyrate kinase [Oscillospiraceae bacterium]
MMNKLIVLAINPGSTSTKIALFDDHATLFNTSISHSPEDLAVFREIQDQLEYRVEMLEKAMLKEGHEMSEVDVYAARGGGLASVTGGVYAISDLMVRHASMPMSGGPHPAQLASQIAKRFADRYGKPAFVVNTPDVDEFNVLSRITGIKGIYRDSHAHTLNQKEIALRYCKTRGLEYNESNFIICHIGGGASITAHEKGRMIDSNDIIKGSGPMSCTRAGDMPYMKIVDLAFSGEYTKRELEDKLNKNGGLTDYFGTSDIRDVIKLIKGGDTFAATILDGMIYQNAKYIGSMAVAMKGNVDAIILTGGVTNNKYFTDTLTSYVDWIADVAVMPGEFELEALAFGALRAISGEEEIKTYTGVPVWSGI